MDMTVVDVRYRLVPEGEIADSTPQAELLSPRGADLGVVR